MYELDASQTLGSGLTGVVAAMACVGGGNDDSAPAVVTHPNALQHRWNALVVVIGIPKMQDPEEATREDRVRATRALFDWIETLPPVPAVDLAAMDRGDLY